MFGMGKYVGEGVCEDCEFCFPNEGGFVCADAHYGKDVTKELLKVKECYSEGFEAYVRRQKAYFKK